MDGPVIPKGLEKPWKILERKITLRDIKGGLRLLGSLSPTDKLQAIFRMKRKHRTDLLSHLETEAIADLLEHAPEAEAGKILEMLPAKESAAVLEELPSDVRADVLTEVDPENAEAILRELPREEADRLRRLVDYPADTAGGLMVTEYLAYHDTMVVRDVIDDIREHGEEYSEFEVQYAHVTDTDGKLIGILPLRDLLFASRSKRLSEVMIRSPHSVPDLTPLEKIVPFFDEHSYIGAPVVDRDGRLVGVLRRSSVRSAVTKSSTNIFLKFSGIIGGEELRTLPLAVRCGRRLSWLSINIVLNIVAASIIAIYQDTLAAVIALAVFLPMISDMSGCSGNQAVAVSMRELTLGLLRPHEVLRVIFKESTLGIINGVVLGALLGTIALLWKGNPWLGLVVGAALAVNTVVAVTLGGLLPLILKRLKFDPALVSGPLLTTVTDMCGFFLVLSIASAMLPLLVV